MIFAAGFVTGFIAFLPIVIGVFYLLDRTRDPIRE